MKKWFLYTALTFASLSCTNALEEEVFSSFGPSNFFKTASDAEALLNSAYAAEQKQGTDGFRNILVMAEVNTDLLIIREGGLRGLSQPLEDFTWNSSHEFFNTAWTRYYQIVYRANVVLDNVPGIEFDATRKAEILAEARFIRASGLMYLYDLFGPVPLITSSVNSASDRPERPTKEAFVAFVASELEAAAGGLPVKANQYGRATKGAALAFLTKFQLNNKQWEAAANSAKRVMDLGQYQLFNGAQRSDVFKLENEVNNEFIYVRPYIVQVGLGTNYLAHAAPPNYKFKGASKTNFAAQLKTPSAFLNSFHPDDQRKASIITEYENTSGQLVKLGLDDARSFKFPEDLPATGADLGNDFPVVRYADILLSRAEALNEIQGPTAEVIDLINQVRTKAGVPTLSLADYNTKQLIRDHILQERGWEFFTEELRRQDLIRHGKFIEYGRQRGKIAQEHHILYPLPQSEIDRNPNLKQNNGYN